MFFPSLGFRRLSKRSFLSLSFSILFLVLSGTCTEAQASSFVVPAGGDLQSALNVAQCGDTVILQAGAVYQAVGDKGFMFPAKASCTGTAADTITVRTSNLSALPSGQR